MDLQNTSKAVALIQNNFKKHLVNWEIIDNGYISKVYKVLDGRDNTQKALKVYDKSLKDECFKLEIEIYQELQHHNLVAFIGAYNNEKCNDSACILMEYCADGNLRQKFAEHRNNNTPIEAREGCDILIGIMNGIHYLHTERDLIHRDLQPRNIMFKNGIAKIGDFRFSKYAYKGPSTSIGGYMCYASPEVVNATTEEQNCPHTKAADIWSFGCILYEMIENVPLINKSGQLQILLAILDKTIERSLTQLDHPLNDIFKSMVMREPGDRPSSGKILEELNAYRATLNLNVDV